MSDTSKTGDGIHENHYCCIPDCKKWGCYGFARSKADLVQWWCAEHCPYKNAQSGIGSAHQST